MKKKSTTTPKKEKSWKDIKAGNRWKWEALGNALQIKPNWIKNSPGCPPPPPYTPCKKELI